jgi:ABC-2 type transport system permease protein
MSLAGTDFQSYKVFQDEAEKYRYLIAQKMNELQIELVSNNPSPDDKPHAISRRHWKEVPYFVPQSIRVASSLKHEAWSIVALLCWCLAMVWTVNSVSKTLKAI